MNRTSMRIATIMVTACVAVGTAGLVRTHSATSSLGEIGDAAAVITGSILSNIYLDLPGVTPDLGERLLASRKPGSSAADGPVREPAAGDVAGRGDVDTASAMSDIAAASEGRNGSAVAAVRGAADDRAASAAARGTERKLAFIYHSHNRESWLPELKGTGKDKPNEAFDAEVNVTLLGARLGKKLEELGVGAVHSGKDYHTAVKSFNYNHSYAYSKTTVKEALAVHEDLVFLLDIHRDASRRKQTTIEIGGKSYAKLYFIVGQGNPDWKENEALAERIHEAMEKKLPGVSKGILTKGTKHGHGEYNQSLSKGSVLIEIGGVDNTLEESNRTVDALAGVVAELAKEAVMAGADGEERRGAEKL